MDQPTEKSCGKCGRVYRLKWERFPFSDIAHDEKCECGAVIVHIEKGTWDCSAILVRAPKASS